VRPVDIAQVLRGVLDQVRQAPSVDHAFAEVYLDDKWLAVDSYVSDAALAERALRRVRAEGAVAGYGMHRDGTFEWDGKSDAFSQCVGGATGPLVLRDFGVFDSPEEFYADATRGVSRIPYFLTYIFWALIDPANRAAEAVRADRIE
jgi:hypothetical protein